MYEALYEGSEQIFPNKPVLNPEEVAQLLDCSPDVIYNWLKRSDPSKRPPKLIIGKSVRFPKKDFLRWLVKEQGNGDIKV